MPPVYHRGARFIASGLGVGFLPRAPGTWASLAACGAAWPLAVFAGNTALLMASSIAFLVGLLVCLPFAHSQDPPWIVIDEIAGQWLVLAVLPPDLLLYALGFALFRLFDILKPPPVDLSERLPGALGIMADDMVAGAMAAAVAWSVATAWGMAS